MNKGANAALLTVVLFGVGLLIAGAKSDLRIETERDEDRNTIYYLKNSGDRLIEARVSMLKDCTGNRHKPIERTFRVPAKGRVKLARAWVETSCRHEYRVREAQYR